MQLPATILLEKPHVWSAASSLWRRSHLFALTTCQKDWISAHWEQIWDPICQFAARVYSRCLYFAYISILACCLTRSQIQILFHWLVLPSQNAEAERFCHHSLFKLHVVHVLATNKKSARRHRLKLGKSAITGWCHELCLCERWCFVTRMILKGDRSDRHVLNI